MTAEPISVADGEESFEDSLSRFLQAADPAESKNQNSNPKRQAGKKAIEDLLRLYELLEPFLSVGRLSIGIGHNLNGYLAGLIGHLELLKMKRPELTQDLDTVLGLAKRLRDGIGEIATKLDNEITREAQPQNVNQILRAELAFLKADLNFKHSVTVELDLQESLPNVYGCYADFALALENVLMNAIDAQRDHEGAWLKVKTFSGDNEIFIEIVDKGPGFSPEALSKAFDLLWPAVRADEDGRVRGGIGLALSRMRLERWGGKISLSNSEGGGARVTIALPKREKIPNK